MKSLILILSFISILGVSGCFGEFVLKDEQQFENLDVLVESYDMIYSNLTGEEPRIPARAVLDSHRDLLREAYELEKAKQRSWEETARERGWIPPSN